MKWIQRKHVSLSASLLLAAVLGFGCGDDGGVGEVALLDIQVTPQTLSFTTGGINTESVLSFEITNVSTGEGVLIVSDVILTASPAFSLECANGRSFSLNQGDSSICEVTFVPTDEAEQSGEVRIKSNAADGDEVVALTTPSLRPLIEAVPPRVAFNAREGETDREIVRIRNVGTYPLEVYGYEVVGAVDIFTAMVEEADYGVFSETAPLVLQPHNDEIGPNDPGYTKNELQVVVDYDPDLTGNDEAQLRIFSNDPSAAVFDIELDGSSEAPCILVVDGLNIDFRDSRIGGINERTITVQNCGNQILEINRVEPGDNAAMIANASATIPFLIDFGDRPSDDDGNLEAAITVAPGETDTFVLGYAPVEEVANTGNVFIHSNDPDQPRLELQLFGRGVINECPTAVARGTIRGENIPPDTQIEAAPLQYLVLDGTNSTDFDGTVVDYQWEVIERPDGSTAQLESVANEVETAGRRQLFLDLAGRFIVELSAIDDGGAPSCEKARVTAVVVPNEAIHIQLVWSNPEDPDETDFSGSDVDLHFNKMGFGSWFHGTYDNYFANRGPFWSPENPSLDIDDTNGAGPENINLDDPIACQWYAVGVHYWREQFGTAYTTIRIFIDGQLRFEYLNKPLVSTDDWWDVARIQWPSGDIILVNEFTEENQPNGVVPPVTEPMTDSGLCGIPE